MADDLNSVKNVVSPKRSYHHGSLRNALIQAAEALVIERGPDGFSLRETARRAGVSAAAPAHHFGDVKGLRTAVATGAFARLGRALEAADREAQPSERLGSQARAYVRFAMSEPATFDLMFRYALIDRHEPNYRAVALHAFDVLSRAARGAPSIPLQEAGENESLPRPPSEHDASMVPAIAGWSLVHGFARLAADGVFGTDPEAARRAVDVLLPSVLNHLTI
jgi:AcrR family transcriptional regulator